jgi:hypothetical protein
VLLGEIEEMLKFCAPGSEMTLKLHHYRVIYKRKTWTSLPKGELGGGRRLGIKVGKVKAIVRFLGIDEGCAYGQLGLPLPKIRTSD